MLRAIMDFIFGPVEEYPAGNTDDQGTTTAVAPPSEATTPSAQEPEPEIPEGWWTPAEPPVTRPPSYRGRVQPVDVGLYDELKGFLADPNLKLPQVPQVTQELLSLLDQDNVSFARAAEVAQRDSVITAEILRIANSSQFRGIREIRRLDMAFARLGVKQLRSVLLGVTMKAIAIHTGGNKKSLGEQLWQQSMASAAASAGFAQRYDLGPEDAFMAGLLHDIGMLVMLKLIHDFQGRGHQRITLSMFYALTEEWHEHLGLRLADSWNLPSPLPELIGQHHTFPKIDDPLWKLRSIVMLSDATCALLRYARYVPYDLFALPAAQKLCFAKTPANCKFLADLERDVRKRVGGSTLS